MPAPTRPAATVLLLRPHDDGFRVFLVQRNRTVGFMPNAWVFPGGRVDAGDRLAGHAAIRGGGRTVERMGLPLDDAIAFLVAGVRETFEESGLWLGEGAVPAAVRDPLARRELELARVLADHGATLDLDRLAAWSWWVTPEVEPKRFDTRFLVALATDGDAVHDAGETVASGWFSPADAVARAESGELPMAPPTWWTLRELAAHGTIEAVFAEAERRPQRPIMPVVTVAPDGAWELILPGHPDHPEPPFPGLPERVRFAQGRWWAEGGDSVPLMR